MTKKQAQNQQIEKLINSTRESVKLRENIKQLFKNQKDLKNNEKELDKKMGDVNKEIKKIGAFKEKLNSWKWASRIATITSGGLSLTSAAVSGSLSLDDCSRKSDIISISGSAVSGFLALTGTGVEYYVSRKEEKFLEREKGQQDRKNSLEKERERDISNKHLRDIERLRNNWSDLKKVFSEDLYLLQRNNTFSNETDKSLKNLLKSYNTLVEKIKRDLNNDSDNLGNWLSLISNAEAIGIKIETSKKSFQDLEKIWQECGISEEIDELKLQINDYCKGIDWELPFEEDEILDSSNQDQQVAGINSSINNIEDFNQSNIPRRRSSVKHLDLAEKGLNESSSTTNSARNSWIQQSPTLETHEEDIESETRESSLRIYHQEQPPKIQNIKTII